MASRGEDAVAADNETITRGSGALLADLSYTDAGERQTKLRLAHTVNSLIAGRRLNQVTAAERLGIAQPKVSGLAIYKLDGLSVERLMKLRTALDQDVDLVMRNKPCSRVVGQIAAAAVDRGA